MGNKNQTQTIKIWRTTLSNLRLLSGITEAPIVEILDKLVKEALSNKSTQKTLSQRKG